MRLVFCVGLCHASWCTLVWLLMGQQQQRPQAVCGRDTGELALVCSTCARVCACSGQLVPVPQCAVWRGVVWLGVLVFVWCTGRGPLREGLRQRAHKHAQMQQCRRGLHVPALCVALTQHTAYKQLLLPLSSCLAGLPAVELLGRVCLHGQQQTTRVRLCFAACVSHWQRLDIIRGGGLVLQHAQRVLQGFLTL